MSYWNDYVIVILELDLYLKVHHKKKDTNMFFSLSLIELPIAKVVYLYGEDKLKQDN